MLMHPTHKVVYPNLKLEHWALLQLLELVPWKSEVNQNMRLHDFFRNQHDLLINPIFEKLITLYLIYERTTRLVAFMLSNSTSIQAPNQGTVPKRI